MKKFMFYTGMIGGVFLICFLCLELVLRVISPPSYFTPLLPLRPNLKMELHPKIRGLSQTAMHSTNKWGMRGDEPPINWDEHYTVVTIGGSTTLCFYLDDHKTWPYLLQEKLKKSGDKVWVGNGGLDGQSTRAHLIFMKEVIPKVKPDAVVLLVGINDLGFSISENWHKLAKDYDEKDEWGWHAKLFLFKSRVVQVLYTWKQILIDKVHVVDTQMHHTYMPKQMEKALPLAPSNKIKAMLPYLDEYRQNLKEIIELGRQMNVKVVLLTQPLLFDESEFWQKVKGGMYWVKDVRGAMSAANLWQFLEAYNHELLDLCEEEGVDCLDLASEIPHDFKIFYDSFHYTEYGSDLVAQKIADFMTQKIPDLN